MFHILHTHLAKCVPNVFGAQILEQLKRKEAFDELTIPVPQLARRHPADEGIDGIPSREAVASAKASGGKLFAVSISKCF